MTHSATVSETKTKAYEIVVGVDFSELSGRAIESAIELAGLRPDAQLHAIAVGETHGDLLTLPGSNESITEERARNEARDWVAGVVQRYRDAYGRVPLERVAVYVVAGDAARQITALARAVDADLIVVGTHGRTGAKRLLLGSVAEAVLRNASCNVHVVRPSDFVDGEKVPEVQPALKPGEPHLKPFAHRPTYHYVHRNSQPPAKVM